MHQHILYFPAQAASSVQTSAESHLSAYAETPRYSGALSQAHQAGGSSLQPLSDFQDSRQVFRQLSGVRLSVTDTPLIVPQPLSLPIQVQTSFHSSYRSLQPAPSGHHLTFAAIPRFLHSASLPVRFAPGLSPQLQQCVCSDRSALHRPNHPSSLIAQAHPSTMKSHSLGFQPHFLRLPYGQQALSAHSQARQQVQLSWLQPPCRFLSAHYPIPA